MTLWKNYVNLKKHLTMIVYFLNPNRMLLSNLFFKYFYILKTPSNDFNIHPENRVMVIQYICLLQSNERNQVQNPPNNRKK